MRFKMPLIAAVLMAGSAALIFYFFQHQLSSASLAFGSHPEVVAEMESSLEDLKRLAELDPENEAAYRERFERLATTARRLQILEHTREDLVRRYELILLSIFGLSVVVVVGLYGIRQSRHEPRLARLQRAVAALAEGRTDLEIGDKGRDAIGRIAVMVEQASRVMARDRQRLATLKHLSMWQEAARRNAHELRTPLTGARLELTRLSDLLEREGRDGALDVRQAAESARQEIDRLARLTEQFHRFARLPQPKLERQDVRTLLEEVVTTYGSAWRNLQLTVGGTPSSPSDEVCVDKDLFRQVLVNLCDNSSLALGEERGTVRFSLEVTATEVRIDVADSGPGVMDEIRDRLFDPYATTRRPGQGTGLGLAISKKIMLDHGGDLELLKPSPGATFRITLPLPSSTQVPT